MVGTVVTAGFLVDVTSSLPRSLFALMPVRLPAGALVACWAVTVIGVGVCVVLSGRVFRGWWGTPADRAVARFRERLVPVSRIETTATRIEVHSAKDLERIARISVAPILQQIDASGHTFAVAADDAVYALALSSDPVIDLREGDGHRTSGPSPQHRRSRSLRPHLG